MTPPSVSEVPQTPRLMGRRHNTPRLPQELVDLIVAYCMDTHFKDMFNIDIEYPTLQLKKVTVGLTRIYRQSGLRLAQFSPVFRRLVAPHALEHNERIAVMLSGTTPDAEARSRMPLARDWGPYPTSLWKPYGEEAIILGEGWVIDKFIESRFGTRLHTRYDVLNSQLCDELSRVRRTVLGMVRELLSQDDDDYDLEDTVARMKSLYGQILDYNGRPWCGCGVVRPIPRNGVQW